MQEPAKTLSEALADYIIMYPKDEEAELFRKWFADRFGSNLRAVIFFGSCLSEKSRSATSFKDFIVVVDSYRETSANPIQWLSHWTLPPDLFHLALGSNGARAECKYYLISTEQLIEATSPRAKDLYLLGRLSKRIALLYSRDEDSRGLIVRAQSRAMQRAATLTLTLALIEPFDLVGFIKGVLRLSYLAETRLEDGSKVDTLYAAYEDFYKETYGSILQDLIAQGLVRENGDGKWKPIGARMPLSSRQVEQFLDLSRRRFKARWPKMILTVDNWLDQLLGKLERTYGIKIDIPAWERPIILITGWRHYFRLKREGKIHERD